MRVMILGNYSRNLVVFRGAVICELVRRGHEVIAVGPEDDAWTAQGLRALGAEFAVVPMARASLNPLSDLVYMVRLARLLRRHQPQAVLTFTHKPNTFGVFAAACSRGRPAIVQLVEGLGYSFIDVRGLRKRLANLLATRLYRVSLHLSSRVLFLNEDDRRVFAAAGLLPRHLPVELVDGIGVNLERFRCSPIPEGQFTFLLIARLLRTKGIEEFCLAARTVKARHPEARFIIVGAQDPSRDGYPLDELRAHIAAGAVEWVGETNEVERYYRQCCVYVLPSYREGVPVTVMEAMASGRPVITTDVPGCRTTVTGGRDGLIVPAKSPERLAEAMLSLIADPTRVRVLAAAARATAERRFDARRLSERQADILEEEVQRTTSTSAQ